MMNLPQMWALNSAVECHPHTVEVVGSNPTAPTISSSGLEISPKDPNSRSLLTAFPAPDSLFSSPFHGCFRHSRLSIRK